MCCLLCADARCVPVAGGPVRLRLCGALIRVHFLEFMRKARWKMWERVGTRTGTGIIGGNFTSTPERAHWMGSSEKTPISSGS